MRHRAANISAVEIVRCIYDAYEGGDARTPGQYFHPDVEGYISEFLPWGGRRKGTDDMREGIRLLREYVMTAFEPSEIIDCGAHVIAIGQTKGFVQQTGATFSVRTVHVWRFESGQIVRFENYLDRELASVLPASLRTA